MKVSDLVEALEMANVVFRKKHGTPMEIFSIEFDHEDGVLIEACRDVSYGGEGIPGSSTTATGPYEQVLIRFYAEDGKIVDRSVELLEDQDAE